MCFHLPNEYVYMETTKLKPQESFLFPKIPYMTFGNYRQVDTQKGIAIHEVSLQCHEERKK